MYFQDSISTYDEDFQTDKSCPRCSTSLYDFMSSGVVGCAYCYEIFKKDINTKIFQKQGSFNHIGKVSLKHISKIKIKEKIEELEIQKEKAAREENFIVAESLKNQIEKLKGEL